MAWKYGPRTTKQSVHMHGLTRKGNMKTIANDRAEVAYGLGYSAGIQGKEATNNNTDYLIGWQEGCQDYVLAQTKENN